jgi:ABC-type nitrate/sulfonate/bicarbonate transport system substrate-binding protein
VTPATSTLVVGSFSPSVLLRVARRTGALDEPGLTVQEEAVPSSPAQFRGLDDGTLDAALTSPDNVVAYRFLADNPLGGTRDVRIVAGVDRGLGLALYAQPDITATEQLRGTVVGVDVAASGFAFALLEILARAGLTAGTDYELVELGSTPKRLQALLDGQCAATMLNAGNTLKADAAGLRRLADVTTVAAPYLGTVLAVQGEPTSAVRALAAVLRETAEVVLSGDGTVHEVAVEEAEATGLPRPLAKQYVDGLADADHGLVRDGSVDMVALESVVALRRRHMPAAPNGTDPLHAATHPSSGLVDEAGG